jgi:hypothetical protein
MPIAALAIALLAAAASGLVLAAAAGAVGGPEQELGVEAHCPSEVGNVLDEAATRTREARARAARELDQLRPDPAGDRARESVPAR